MKEYNLYKRFVDIFADHGVEFDVGEAPVPSEILVKSSTEGSSKIFKISVNDSGTVSAAEVVEEEDDEDVDEE